MGVEGNQLKVNPVNDSWVVVDVLERVDSFNFDQVCSELKELASDQKRSIVLNLEQSKFLCLPGIKYISNMAEDLKAKGRKVALLAPSEKLKRQIDIYATLDHFHLFRTHEDMKEWVE